MLTTDNSILFKSGPLGNWYGCSINYLGTVFHSSEQLFMYFKAMYFSDLDIASKLKSVIDPHEAKKLGRLVKNFSEFEWVSARFIIMYRTLNYKFMYCSEFRDALLDPSYINKNFVECNEFDSIWSCGLSINEAIDTSPDSYPGLNLLGKCLDKLRSNNL